MIQPSELRLGNWVHHERVWSHRQPDYGSPSEFDFQWEERDWYAIGESTINFDDVSPIVITEEWLEKLGFEYERATVGGWERWEKWTSKKGRIKLLDKKFSWGIGEYSNYIQYVHQLQNLYFSLTGEELTIKK